MEKSVDIYKLFPENECSCPKCVEMCSNSHPCRGTADDIRKIINAGFGDMLMLDYYFNEEGIPVQMLVPALTGFEDTFAPINPIGRCAFLDKYNKCILHDAGLKPLEGRVASCISSEPAAIIPHIADTWAEALGEQIVEEWHNKHS